MDTEKNGSTALWPETEAGRKVRARLSDERTLEAIDHLLARIDTLEKAVEDLNVLMRQAPGLVAMAGDMLDDTYRQAEANGVNPEERLKNALHLANKFTDPEMIKKLDGLLLLGERMPGIISMIFDSMDEKMQMAMAHGFDPRVLSQTAGNANTALTNAMAEPPAKVGGIFGLLRAIKDPDRQKGLGFLLNFLKHFGRQL